MSKPRLLVTGANGLIGRLLLTDLREGFDVVGLDLRVPEGDGSIRQCDVTDLQCLQSIFADLGPINYVLHLAADSRVEADWQSILSNNIEGTWNVFLASSENEVSRVVFASSNHVTGYYERNPPRLHLEPARRTISLADPVRPDGPYGISKLAGEAIARYFYDKSGMEAVCLRIGSVLSDDDPTREERDRATWLSHRDLRQLVTCALTAGERFPGFGIYYGVSRNEERFWEISSAQKEIGYNPEDDASKLA